MFTAETRRKDSLTQRRKDAKGKKQGSHMLELSKHFGERWVKRVGGPVPDEAEVARLIDESVEIQKFSIIREPGKPKPRRILRLCWVPELDLVFKVDEGRNRVVTVLTPETA